MSLQERVFGLETEYAINFYPEGSSQIPDNRVIVQALQSVLVKDHGAFGTEFLEMGAKFHYDVGHAEWGLPECRTAHEAAVYDKAADHLLAEALPDAEQILRQRNFRGNLFIAKNNVDSQGNTYGCHENYLMLRDTELLVGDHFLRYLARCLIPFLVTRQIFTGAGRTLIDPLGQPIFELSQRAAFIDTVVSRETTSERPLLESQVEKKNP